MPGTIQVTTLNKRENKMWRQKLESFVVVCFKIDKEMSEVNTNYETEITNLEVECLAEFKVFFVCDKTVCTKDVCSVNGARQEPNSCDQ